jgi:AbrB family looped-hinge helix DNA binding protein
MPLVKVKEKFQVTIPIQIRKLIHLEVGDILEMVARDNTIVFKPKSVVDRESVDAAIKEGLKDCQEGRLYGPFKSVEEFEAGVEKFKKSRKV